MTQAARPDGRGTYHDDFRLSITKALGDQLAQALTHLGRAPLAEQYLASLDERPGVYQLYLRGEFVYVGKADKSLPGRLANHLRKLSGRRNIDLRDVTFSCLYVDEDFSALAPEQLLISHHKEMGNIPWNNNGFGNKDPGRQRDSTVLKKNHFDVIFPIDLDRPVEGLEPGQVSLSSFLKALKSGLPYNFRYAEPPRPKSTFLTVSRAGLSADEAFRLVSEVLPETWQIAALMGYVIMYPDSPNEYKSAWRYYRSGKVLETEPEASPEEITQGDLLDADE
ncbi:Eco29kI family restriction endonuclease [Streptomyces radiopugnans]|uniref:GIY-YIG catalytic domain-containing protein n=1 Tax=Streptomyces radiopugnans TaxID=403935 RepID=A0A1H9CQW9_9ACTN|nr:Eco29kI family restriction endonuclease [Streptomyces radiopugnans]SEQ03008.1 GIY-YIG catalytic domain-containing protein [Streptomyces radiopugnans]